MRDIQPDAKQESQTCPETLREETGTNSIIAEFSLPTSTPFCFRMPEGQRYASEPILALLC